MPAIFKKSHQRSIRDSRIILPLCRRYTINILKAIIIAINSKIYFTICGLFDICLRCRKAHSRQLLENEWFKEFTKKRIFAYIVAQCLSLDSKFLLNTTDKYSCHKPLECFEKTDFRPATLGIAPYICRKSITNLRQNQANSTKFWPEQRTPDRNRTQLEFGTYGEFSRGEPWSGGVQVPLHTKNDVRIL